MKTGIELITEERKRQIESEGYSIEHDLEHAVREFIRAAETYLRSSDLTLHSKEFSPSDNWHQTNEPVYRNEIERSWPWEQESFKPTSDVRDLIKAGALIAAAIDRLNARKINIKNRCL